ncbi:MAG: hypothetical protein ACFFBD_13145 [Candidatus Hodarchaeota archaeon]
MIRIDILADYPYNRIKQVFDQLVIERQTSEGKLTATSIIKKVRICYLDSNEISNMLSYLTSFGWVKKTGKGWILENHDIKNKYGKFKRDLIKDCEEILNNLSKVPKTANDLATKVNKSAETVKTLLSFLEEITSQGIVTQVDENFPPTWELT